jgi:hypothetical protein
VQRFVADLPGYLAQWLDVLEPVIINQRGKPMASNEPLSPNQDPAGTGQTRDLGDLRVSTGAQSAYVTIEMILYVLAVLGIFVTAAIVDGDGPGDAFDASQAWFYVTLLTIGLFLNRGLARIHSRGERDHTF